MFNAAVERDGAKLLRTLDVKGRAFGLPAIWLLTLVAAHDLLLEEPVLIVNAVAEARHTHGGERFQKARCQTSKTAIAETGVRLNFENIFQMNIQVRENGAAGLHKAEIAEVIAEPAAHEKFHGQVIKAFCILVAIALLGFKQAVGHQIANGKRDRLEHLAGNQSTIRPRKSIADVPQNGIAKGLGTATCTVKQVSRHFEI